MKFLTMKQVLLLAAVALVIAAPSQAQPFNQPPPSGAILDLNGTPIPGGGDNTAQQYAIDFFGAVTSTNITFALREDPAYISLSEIELLDLTNPGGNLLLNGDFSGGTYTDNGNSLTPDNWTYANMYGAIAGGRVDPNCGELGTDLCWFDGAVQAYDAISQNVATTVGDLYEVSFWVADNSGCETNGGPPCNFSDLSTNGDTTDDLGNGIDVLVYAQSGLPAAGTPEPASLILVGAGLLGLSWKLRKGTRS